MMKSRMFALLNPGIYDNLVFYLYPVMLTLVSY